MKNKKKGFTLVELLVVIAIVAILATVSIVGYLSFTEKAKDANDQTLITQLNHVLQAEEVDYKPRTMDEAIKTLNKRGFVIERLTPTSAKNEFVYDLNKNRFVLKTVDEVTNTATADPTKWLIVKTEDRLNQMTDRYSVYLASDFIENQDQTKVDQKLTVKNGFDAGVIQTTFDVTYNNQTANKSVVMKTNDGTLTLNGSDTDNVEHFGKSSTVNVNKVGMNSYHIYGKISQIYLTQGRVSLENNSELDELLLTENAVLDKIKVNIASNVKKFPKVINTTNSKFTAFDEKNNPIQGLETVKGLYVSNENDLEYGLWPLSGEPAKYIVFRNDIIVQKNNINIIDNVTIDGRGFMLKGKRSASDMWVKDETVITFNQDGNKFYDVAIKNLNIEGTSTKQKNLTLALSHFVNNLTLENVNIKNIAVNGSCIGVLADLGFKQININMKNCNLVTTSSGYGLKLERNSNIDMDNVKINGYNSIYANSNSNGTVLNINNSRLINENPYDGEANAFGCIVTFASQFEVNLSNTYINSISTGKNCFQYAFLSHTDDTTVNRPMDGLKLNVSNGSIIEGKIAGLIGIGNLGWDISLKDSKFTSNPNEPKFGDCNGFVPNTHKVVKEGIYYNVITK